MPAECLLTSTCQRILLYLVLTANSRSKTSMNVRWIAAAIALPRSSIYTHLKILTVDTAQDRPDNRHETTRTICSHQIHLFVAI